MLRLPSRHHSAVDDRVDPQPVWTIVAAIENKQFTGEVSMNTVPAVRVYAVNGDVYLAECDGDAPLATRLIDAGLLTTEQLASGIVDVGGAPHLGRLFVRQPEVDRDRVELTIATANERLLERLALTVVSDATATPLKHHRSGIHHWRKPQPMVMPVPVVETPVVETPVVEAPVVEAPVLQPFVVEAPVVETPVVETPVVETPVIEPPEPSAPAPIVFEAQPSTPSVLAEQPTDDVPIAELAAMFDAPSAAPPVVEPAPVATPGPASIPMNPANTTTGSVPAVPVELWAMIDELLTEPGDGDDRALAEAGSSRGRRWGRKGKS